MMLDYLYKNTITVFNRVVVDETIVWIPHILRNVHATISNGATVSTYGDAAQDSASVNIRYFGDRDAPKIGDIEYVKPKQFQKLNLVAAQDYITFAYGDNFDFFMVGEWEGGDIIKDEDYGMNAGFFNYMNREYDDVYAIASCAKYDYLPHFTITAR